MVHADAPVGLDGVTVEFDDERAVADAGIVLTATLAQRLGIEMLVDRTVDLGERPGAANAGAKVMTLVSAMALGADCIDDCDILRAGRTGQVLGHRVAAPSTSTASSAKSMAAASRVHRSATPASAAITRCSPRAPTPARCCTSAAAPGRRTPHAGCCASATSSSPASRAR